MGEMLRYARNVNDGLNPPIRRRKRLLKSRKVNSGDDTLRLAMVNDCAYVAETLIKYLPEISSVHLKRSRKIWDKTFGITWRILRTDADIFHVHYLLQDCYLALRFGKRPVIGHAHGSDLRTSLNHPIWGRIVRHNLKNCDKVLVSTIDVLDQARTFRLDAEYLPNPVDTQLFYPKPFLKRIGKRRVLIASDSNWGVKGTDTAIRSLASVKQYVEVSIIQMGVDFDRTAALASSLGLHLNVLPKVSHERINEYYWNSDVVIDRFTLGSLGMVSLEAIASGRPVLNYVSSEYDENRDFPLKDLKESKEIAAAVKDLPPELWEQEYAFIKKHHDTVEIVAHLVSIYNELLDKRD